MKLKNHQHRLSQSDQLALIEVWENKVEAIDEQWNVDDEFKASPERIKTLIAINIRVTFDCVTFDQPNSLNTKPKKVWNH